MCGSLREGDTQKVALEQSLQLLEDAFLEKMGEGAKAVSAWVGEGKRLNQCFREIGASSVSIPFVRKWLKSSLVKLFGK